MLSINRVAPLHWQYKDLLNFYSLCFEKCDCSFRWVGFGRLCCTSVCLCSPCCPAPRGTWSGSGRLFLRCSLAVWTPLLPVMRCASAPEGCGTKHSTWDKSCVKQQKGHVHSSAGVFIPLSPHQKTTCHNNEIHYNTPLYSTLVLSDVFYTKPVIPLRSIQQQPNGPLYRFLCSFKWLLSRGWQLEIQWRVWGLVGGAVNTTRKP